VFETVCDDAAITRCALSWNDGSGDRREELEVTPGWWNSSAISP